MQLRKWQVPVRTTRHLQDTVFGAVHVKVFRVAEFYACLLLTPGQEHVASLAAVTACPVTWWGRDPPESSNVL
jgi:hypothetical protein